MTRLGTRTATLLGRGRGGDWGQGQLYSCMLLWEGKGEVTGDKDSYAPISCVLLGEGKGR